MRQIHNAGIDSLFRNSAIDIQYQNVNPQKLMYS